MNENWYYFLVAVLFCYLYTFLKEYVSRFVEVRITQIINGKRIRS